jgi:FtsP/CotA-like multicopper oxidase with cupredoxin domain
MRRYCGSGASDTGRLFATHILSPGLLWPYLDIAKRAPFYGHHDPQASTIHWHGMTVPATKDGN